MAESGAAAGCEKEAKRTKLMTIKLEASKYVDARQGGRTRGEVEGQLRAVEAEIREKKKEANEAGELEEVWLRVIWELNQIEPQESWSPFAQNVFKEYFKEKAAELQPRVGQAQKRKADALQALVVLEEREKQCLKVMEGGVHSVRDDA